MYFCVSKTKGAQRKLTTEPVQIKCFEIFAPGLFRWYNRCNQITFITFPLPLIISSYNVTSSTFLSSTTNYHLFFSLARSVSFDIIFWLPVSSFSFLTFPFQQLWFIFYYVLNINPPCIFSFLPLLSSTRRGHLTKNIKHSPIVFFVEVKKQEEDWKKITDLFWSPLFSGRKSGNLSYIDTHTQTLTDFPQRP